MKNLIIISAVILSFAASQICGCCSKANAQTSATNQENKQQTQPQTVTLKVTGMTCAGCSNHVSKALKNVDGVLEQKVKYPGNTAVVKYDASKTSEEKIIAAIKEAGYKAEVIKEQKRS
jgi:mercuric ion binding protein